MERLREPIREILGDDPRRPSITTTVSTSAERLKTLINGGHLECFVTEKIDGMTFEVGVDNTSFFTRTASSEKYRCERDFEDQIEHYPHLAEHFTWLKTIHFHLFTDHNLYRFLSNNRTSIKGELIPLPLSSSAGSTIRFNVCSYSTDQMGSFGLFAPYTQVNRKTFRPIYADLGTNMLPFISDANKELTDSYFRLDVSDLKEILASKGFYDARAKITFRSDPRWETVVKCAETLRNRIRQRFMSFAPHIGPDIEGWVIHPIRGDRYKIMHPGFFEKRDALKGKT